MPCCGHFKDKRKTQPEYIVQRCLIRSNCYYRQETFHLVKYRHVLLYASTCHLSPVWPLWCKASRITALEDSYHIYSPGQRPSLTSADLSSTPTSQPKCVRLSTMTAPSRPPACSAKPILTATCYWRQPSKMARNNTCLLVFKPLFTWTHKSGKIINVVLSH